jgi:hypothetical protein
MEDEFDAVIYDWVLVIPDATGAVIIGCIRDDQKARFPNGRMVKTSFVTSPLDQVYPGAIVQTINSRYLLAESGWATVVHDRPPVIH